MADEEGIKRRLLENWKEEIQAATFYNRLADREPDPNRKRILGELATTEESHATRWATRLAEMSVEVPSRESVKLPVATDLSLRLAPVERLVAQQEAAERRLSLEHAQGTGDELTDKLLAQIAIEDAEHAGTLRLLMGGGAIQGTPHARTALGRILAHETWHQQSSAGWIGGAIYGVNDGLAAVFGIVSGTAAATSGGHFVLIAGLAGAVASAVSMGSGAYLATKSEGEVYEAQLHHEKREIDEAPEEERRELELFYQLKGLSESEARVVVDAVAKDPKRLLEAMAQEELNLGPNTAGGPIPAGIAAGVSTAVGAIIPVIPFFFATGFGAVWVAAAISILAHFAVGAAKSLVTLRSWWSSGLEMTIVGIVVGAVTYGVGLLLHVS
jgi:VIT1/CCC1 family predicted Fe2+/Mn2+ transporter/rubrerythrin